MEGQKQAEGVVRLSRALQRAELSSRDSYTGIPGILSCSGRSAVRFNSGMSTCVSEGTGVQVSLELLSFGNVIRSFLAGMCEECRKLTSKYLGDIVEKQCTRF